MPARKRGLGRARVGAQNRDQIGRPEMRPPPAQVAADGQQHALGGFLGQARLSHGQEMLAGTRPIPPGVADLVQLLQAEAEQFRAGRSLLERQIAEVRAAIPRASLIYAQILAMLARHPSHVAIREIGAELDADPNSSTVSQALHRLEGLGLVEIDRDSPANVGYGARLVRS